MFCSASLLARCSVVQVSGTLAVTFGWNSSGLAATAHTDSVAMCLVEDMASSTRARRLPSLSCLCRRTVSSQAARRREVAVMNIIDINEDEMRGDRNEWMMKVGNTA